MTNYAESITCPVTRFLGKNAPAWHSSVRGISNVMPPAAYRWKDYRIDGPDRWKTMTLAPFEFIRRFLIHVLPKGFHRIRHYGLFANGNRAANIARLRELLRVAPVVEQAEEQAPSDDQRQLPCPCPRCGGRMIIIETFAAGMQPTSCPAPTPIRLDTS